MENAIVPAHDAPQALMRRATDVAGVCKEIVKKTAVSIQNRKYVRIEGWQSIALAHGCILSARDVTELPSGWRAVGDVRRMDTGLVLASAEGFVGREERAWGQRDEYACRAMAQTRAMSRAARSAFAHVVVLMDSGLETTPAEEVPPGGFQDTPPARPPLKQAVAATPQSVEGRTETAAPAAPNGDTVTEIQTQVKAISFKKGEKNGRQWELFTIETEHGTYKTFDKKLAETAKACKETEACCILKWKPGRRPEDRELVAVEAVTEPTPEGGVA